VSSWALRWCWRSGGDPLGPCGAALAETSKGDRPDRPDARPACPSPAACLAALKALPETDLPDQVAAEREDALRGTLVGYGKAAIPDLLRLLAGPEREARKQAAFTLGDIDGLASTDLPHRAGNRSDRGRGAPIASFPAMI
jgi:hypothetical protein